MWVEVDRLIREVTALCEFPHAEGLEARVRARDVVAEAAMAVGLAALSSDALSQVEGHDLIARAQETAAPCGAGHELAQRFMAEAKALRAKGRIGGYAKPTEGVMRTTPATTEDAVGDQERKR